MKIKYILSLIILVIISTGFIGCDLLKKRVDKQETSTYTLNSSGKTRLKIKNISGDIKISKAKDSVKTIMITAVKTGKVKQSDNDKPLDYIKIKIDTSSDVITVETEITKEKGWFKKNSGNAVDYDVLIPADMKINIDNVNGDLILENIGNDIDAKLVNGKINFDGCYGFVNLSLNNGSVNGNVDSTKGIKVDVINGSVKLGKMKNLSAVINASTVNGSVKFGDLAIKNVVSDKKSVKGTLGDGKSLIRLSSVNGSIVLNEDDVALKNDKRKRSGDFEGLQFNFDDDEDSNTRVKINSDQNNYKNDRNAYDTLKAAYDSLKNKMLNQTPAPNAPKVR